MWIRDDLPRRLPGIRFLLYGYETRLVQSKSFQTIPDLAITLIQTLKAIGWSEPSARQTLFLAHSLGGVLLKQTLVMLADSDVKERAILDHVRGAVFFGVPSTGMRTEDIAAMLVGQPNTALVDDLSDRSDFLPKLQQQFDGISHIQNLHCVWAFETNVTPSIEVSCLLHCRSQPFGMSLTRIKIS
jgi:hypothetical protein